MAFRTHNPNVRNHDASRGQSGWSVVAQKGKKQSLTSRKVQEVPSFHSDFASLLKAKPNEKSSIFTSKNMIATQLSNELIGFDECLRLTNSIVSDHSSTTWTDSSFDASSGQIVDFPVGSTTDKVFSTVIQRPERRAQPLASSVQHMPESIKKAGATAKKSRLKNRPLVNLSQKTSHFKMEKLFSSHCSKLTIGSHVSSVDPTQAVHTGQIKSTWDRHLVQVKKSAFRIYEDRTVEQEPTQQHLPSRDHLMESIRRLSLSSTVEDAKKADDILRDMVARQLQPHGRIYNGVIHNYAKLGYPDLAQEVLFLMFQDFKAGNTKAEPNVRCFTTVLHAWRKSGLKEAPDRCGDLLAQMDNVTVLANLPQCKPDIFAMTVLLQCWADSNCTNASKRAESVFRSCKNRYLQGDIGMRPDTISYSILMNCYQKLNEANAAETLLWEMMDDFLGGNTNCAPTTRNFNTILALLAKSHLPDKEKRADNLVGRFQALASANTIATKPDEYTYSLLLKCWTSCNRSDGVDKAAQRLDWCRDLHTNGDEGACPDVVKYTTIISAYAQKGHCVQAHLILKKMIEEFFLGNEKAQPGPHLFCTVIMACLKKGSQDAPKHAEKVLRTMWVIHERTNISNLRPSYGLYKRIIMAFAQEKMAQEAEDLMWEMEKRCVACPSRTMFQTIVNAWSESTQSAKDHRIKHLSDVAYNLLGIRLNTTSGFRANEFYCR